MTPDAIFSAASTAAMLGWSVLIAGIAFNRPLLRDVIAGRIFPVALSLVYLLLIALYWSGAEGGFDTLANVQKLFASPRAALAGWIHYLAFDLAIGAWLSRKLMAAGVSRLALIPVLPLTFLFGPIGYLLGQAMLLTRSRQPLQ
jgi:Domain of unknown function (DUF4281)